ncbi:hypothetical protein TNCV_2747001 [Trichonephila clavipes]|nr:hypothetical protein TNCV_2747001 [Trichonephila clavipes]
MEVSPRRKGFALRLRNSGRVQCRIVLLKFPKFVGMHNGIRHDAYVLVTSQSHFASEVPHHANCTRTASLQNSTSLNSLLLTCMVHGFMRMSSYPYRSISSIRQRVSSHQQSNVDVDGPR